MYCGPEFLGWHGWFGFPFGWLLVGLVVWAILSMARRDRPVAAAMAACPGCARTIDPHWKYCPVCGTGTAAAGERR